jgi:hypothetical protein
MMCNQNYNILCLSIYIIVWWINVRNIHFTCHFYFFTELLFQDRSGCVININRPAYDVKRMEDYAILKRKLKGRPRMRWLDDVESDLKKMKVKGWKEKMRDRKQLRLVVEESKAHPGLQCRVAGSPATWVSYSG